MRRVEQAVRTAAMGTAVLILLSCEPPTDSRSATGIAGDYSGFITSWVNSPTGPIPNPDTQFVFWKFTSSAYRYTIDDTKSILRLYCDAFGNYRLTEVLTLEQVRGNATNQECDSLSNPRGEFNIAEMTNQRLQFYQLVADTALEVTLNRR